ncbi:MAG: AAA family ATPase [Chloroflexota bacterium]|nr:AAA family ATPase [Chloroflexota bacterium]
MLKSLPVGIQTFRKIIEQEYLYVDKTEEIYRLITTGEVYFLARPRRFGKSLLISTLAEIFEGRRGLFEGLWIYDSDYEWTEHPVIRIDFSLLRVTTDEELKRGIKSRLNRIAQQYGVSLKEDEYYEQFADLILQLAARSKVVILVDEYDKPIIDNVESAKEARSIRDVLKGFYTVIKGMDEHLRFVLLTGVSKFSKVGVFSGLNNLKDITMDDRFAALLGITQTEVETCLGDYIEALVKREGMSKRALLEKIKSWYDGFCFSKKCVPVYNPFSILLLFDMQDFRNYWFETGTPTFLIKLIREQNYDVREIENLHVNELAFGSYEIEDLAILPLLFQTGYLTIKGYDPQRRLYELYYPNSEVETAFLKYLVGEFSAVSKGVTDSYLWRMVDALDERDFDEFFEVLQVFFAEIPYDIQIKREKYYQTIFYLIFKLIGLQVGAEVRTNRGRIDAVVELEEEIFIFEFKLDSRAEDALEQIRERGYSERYRMSGKDIYLIGVEFGMGERRVMNWQIVKET